MSSYDFLGKEHVSTMLEWLFISVHHQGGDGDAVWYVRFPSFQLVKDTLKEMNEERFKYNYQDDNEHTSRISYDQADLIITNSREEYDKTGFSIKLIF